MKKNYSAHTILKMITFSIILFTVSSAAFASETVYDKWFVPGDDIIIDGNVYQTFLSPQYFPDPDNENDTRYESDRLALVGSDNNSIASKITLSYDDYKNYNNYRFHFENIRFDLDKADDGNRDYGIVNYNPFHEVPAILLKVEKHKPKITFTIEKAKTDPNIGDTVTAYYIIENDGETEADNMKMRIKLPENISLVSSDFEVDSKGELVWKGSLGAKNERRFKTSVKITGTGTLTEIGNITYSYDNSDQIVALSQKSYSITPDMIITSSDTVELKQDKENDLKFKIKNNDDNLNIDTTVTIFFDQDIIVKDKDTSFERESSYRYTLHKTFREKEEKEYSFGIVSPYSGTKNAKITIDYHINGKKITESKEITLKTEKKGVSYKDLKADLSFMFSETRFFSSDKNVLRLNFENPNKENHYRNIRYYVFSDIMNISNSLDTLASEKEEIIEFEFNNPEVSKETETSFNFVVIYDKDKEIIINKTKTVTIVPKNNQSLTIKHDISIDEDLATVKVILDAPEDLLDDIINLIIDDKHTNLELVSGSDSKELKSIKGFINVPLYTYKVKASEYSPSYHILTTADFEIDGKTYSNSKISDINVAFSREESEIIVDTDDTSSNGHVETEIVKKENFVKRFVNWIAGLFS